MAPGKAPRKGTIMKTIKVITKALNGVIDTGLIILFLLFLLIGAYIMADTLYIYSGASQRGALTYKPDSGGEDVGVLKELSEDCIGWITVDGTNIDYPLMQGRTNAEYLNTDPFGEYSLSGSIFLDCNNRSSFEDPYSVIYGHHMEGNVMFGVLDKYLSEEFFEARRTGRITLSDGTVCELRIFAVLPCSARDTEIFDIREKGPGESFLTDHALYLKDYGNGKIVALTTCYGAGSEDRLAVLAELIR